METIIDYFLGRRHSLLTIVVLIAVAGYVARNGMSFWMFAVMWTVVWLACLGIDDLWQRYRYMKRSREIDSLHRRIQERRKAWADDDE